jgi:outer membrane lipoprotein-sorting protein
MLIRTLILAFFIMLSPSIFAQYDNLINSLKQKFQTAKTLEADLKQTNYFYQQDFTLESVGKIYLQGNDIVLEYTQPYYQFMKSIDNTMTVYSQNENIAVVSNSDNQMINSVLHFSSLLSQDLEFVKKEKGLLIFNVLKPVETIKDLKISIDENKVFITYIEYCDDEGNTVKIELSNQKINSSLSKKIDDFIVPAGATIIEN